jgi:hypothetical protein
LHRNIPQLNKPMFLILHPPLNGNFMLWLSD